MPVFEKEKPHEFGLLISRHRDVCNEIRVSVSIVRRDDRNANSIVNASGRDTTAWDERCPRKHHDRMYQDLEMSGQVYSSSSDGNIWIAYEPRYRSVYSLELNEAERIVKTLKAFNKATAKWRKEYGSNEILPATMLALFSRFVDAKFVVFRDYVEQRSPAMFSEMTWEFMTIAKGLEVYQREINRLCRDHVDPWKRKESAA